MRSNLREREGRGGASSEWEGEKGGKEQGERDIESCTHTHTHTHTHISSSLNLTSGGLPLGKGPANKKQRWH